MGRLEEELARLRSAHGFRALKQARGRDFTSNDYLGLARHPAIREAVVAAIDADGAVGAGGSRLLRGNHPQHEFLEQRAAQFFGSEAALFLGSGYLANLALFTTLPARHDAVIFDEAIHASMKEGLHAGTAERYRAQHNDPDSFAQNLRRAREKGAQGLWIAVESVYSMDGDFAPLGDLLAFAEEYDATLIVDEAHATGIFGATGRGCAESLSAERVIALHTCGKALGVAGALVTAPRIVVDYLINKARPFIYSTALPPLIAAAVTRALALVDEEPWRRARLKERIAFAEARLMRRNARFAGSQILPVILGEEERTIAVATALQEKGFDVRPILPPTVPAGTARLRISLHAEHGEGDIAALADALEEVLP
jgi:8-amino-7-oxononanoate synthase